MKWFILIVVSATGERGHAGLLWRDGMQQSHAHYLRGESPAGCAGLHAEAD